MIMKPAEAATEYWATIDGVQAAKANARRHAKASEVLKEHMATEGITTFRGIDMTTTPYEGVDLKLLESKDPDLVDACKYAGVRRALIPRKRPKPTKAAAA